MIDIFKPVEYFANLVVYDIAKLKTGSHSAESLHFFVYDVIKIFMLLFAISFVIGLIKGFVTPEKTRKFLKGKHSFLSNIIAALIGVVTPFCSCSACPLFIGFIEAGIPLGVTFSYLISAPMVNEVAIILLWGLFGLKVTAVYIFSGLMIAILGGIIIGSLNLEKYIEDFVFEEKSYCSCCKNSEITFENRINEAIESSLNIFKKTAPFIVVGVGVGALIHGYAPAELLIKNAAAESIFAVPFAVLVGIPLYANIAGILPIAEALSEQGLPIETILAFTMSVTAISLPEIMILRRVLKPRLLGIFVGILTFAIIFTGYLFNFIL